MTKYDGIIFDKDGVLIDSRLKNYSWALDVRVEEAKRLGLNLSRKEVLKLVYFTSKEEARPFLNTKNFSWKQYRTIEEKVMSRKRQLIDEEEIKTFSGVSKALNKINKPKAVLSNAPIETTRYSLEAFNLRSYFSSVEAPRLSDDGEFLNQRKPNTVLMEKIVEEMELNNPLMVGDSEFDIKAARNMGIDVAHITTYHSHLEPEPDIKIDNLSELNDFL